MREKETSDRQKYLYNLHANHEDSHPFTKGLKLSRELSDQLGKSAISISSYEGQMIRCLLEPLSLNHFVEIGTLTGYSSLWILSALSSQSVLWTIEKEPQHFEFSKKVFASVGTCVVDDESRAEYVLDNKRIILILGDARVVLPNLPEALDGVFIDANKAAYGDYLAWAESRLSKGSVVLADNVFLWGGVYDQADSGASDKQVAIMKSLNSRLCDSKIYQSVLLPTEEGLLFARKL